MWKPHLSEIEGREELDSDNASVAEDAGSDIL
jgi:hypothetical protein